jgi:uncharacterized protein YkwD
MICKLFRKKRKYKPKRFIIHTEATQKLLKEINQTRKENNKEHLIPDGNLQAEAQLRSEQISKDFSHLLFKYSAARLKRLGIKSSAEILARGYIEPDKVINAWLHSPEHRKILLATRYKYIGIGITDKYISVILAR